MVQRARPAEQKNMASYRLSTQVLSRSSGDSVVGASCYRSATKAKDEKEGKTHNYERKSGVLHSEIRTPENAPERFKDRSKLWNEVEKTERRKDAQLAREVQLSLPFELNKKQQIALTTEFVDRNFVEKGMVADISVHDQKAGNANYHAHIMLTMRDIEGDEFGKKNRDWNKKEMVEKWRKDWAETQNKYLEQAGFSVRVDHRNLKQQGKTQIKTVHMGKQNYMKDGFKIQKLKEQEINKTKAGEVINGGIRRTGSSLKKRRESHRQAFGQAIGDIEQSIQKRARVHTENKRTREQARKRSKTSQNRKTGFSR